MIENRHDTLCTVTKGDTMAEQVTNYKCPTCTGPLQFSASTGKLECEYCGSSFSVEEIEALYEAENAKATEAKEQADAAAEAAKEDEWTVTDDQWNESGMKTYNCPSCGADLVCEDTLAASSCPYCGNPTIVPGQFTGMLKPDYVIPFKYDKKQAVAGLQKHYGKRFLLPKTFKDTNHLEEIKGVYVPFWLYDGSARGDCTYEGVKSNTQKKGKKEIEIRKYYHVERSGELGFEKIPADASTHMDHTLMESVEPYNYEELKPFSKAYLTGYMADKYDISAEENADRASSRARESTKNALRNDADNYDELNAEREDIHVEQGKVNYALMPVWLLSTKWNDQNFTFAMNGQTGKMVGDLPVNKTKLAITSMIILALSFALCYFAIEFSVGMSILVAAVITAIIAFALYNSMMSVAKATTADNYIKQGSVNITHRVDRYLREERIVTEIDDD